MTLRFFHAAADAVAINTNVVETLLADSLCAYFIKGKQVFSNGPSSLPRNPPYHTILDNWVFGNSISADELFAKS